MLRQGFPISRLFGMIDRSCVSSVNKCKLVLPRENAFIACSLCGTGNTARSFHCSLPRSKSEDRREMIASMPVKDDGTVGEKSIDIDTSIKRTDDMFPDENTPNRLFNGIPFSQLPVCNIRVSPNNTIISISDYKGVIQLIRSCGIEGFKNTRKGTNIAAQATAISLSSRAVDRGVKTVRVKVRGLGPGRMSAIKGLQMGGLEIVSVTDNTPVSWNPPRPRKQRKL